jgi:hypothetical protein
MFDRFMSAETPERETRTNITQEMCESPTFNENEQRNLERMKGWVGESYGASQFLQQNNEAGAATFAAGRMTGPLPDNPADEVLNETFPAPQRRHRR